MAGESRGALLLPGKKTLFLSSAKAGGGQKLVFSEAKRMVPPYSEDTLFCARCSLDILTASLPLHSPLTFQDLGGFSSYSGWYGASLLQDQKFPIVEGCFLPFRCPSRSGYFDALRGAGCVLVPADGIWGEPNPQQLFQPLTPCVAA